MEGISLIRYSPNSSKYTLTKQLVECYRDVFADKPWHEWLKCSKCQAFWGKKDWNLLVTNEFIHCGEPLTDFWPQGQVLHDLYHEITPEASCWLAVNNTSVVGFCWGYPIAITDLEKKLGVSFCTELEYKATDLVAYQDEVGVVADHREHKIAKAMIVHRLDDFLEQGLGFGIVRTRQNPEPSETYLWYTNKLGYKILANYPSEDGRVILGRRLEGLKELLFS